MELRLNGVRRTKGQALQILAIAVASLLIPGMLLAHHGLAAYETAKSVTVIDDPKACTKPWTGTKPFKLRPDWDIAEYVCEDNFNNKAIQEISK